MVGERERWTDNVGGHGLSALVLRTANLQLVGFWLRGVIACYIAMDLLGEPSSYLG